MNWTMTELLALVRLSNAAYLADSKDAVNAMPGMEWVSQLGNGQCNVTIARWKGMSVAAFQGTLVEVESDRISIPELWDNVDPSAVDLGAGARACDGYWSPLERLWPDVLKVLPAGPVLLTGHSLGGVRAQLAKRLAPHAAVVSYGAPCGANKAFWQQTYADGNLVRVVHENDFAPAWAPGLFEDWTQPGPMQWLHNGKMVSVEDRTGVLVTILDPACVEAHSIDTGYIPAIAALAGGQ